MNDVSHKVTRTKEVLKKYNKLRKEALESMDDEVVLKHLSKTAADEYSEVLECIANLDA